MLAMVILAVSGAVAVLVFIVAWTQPQGIRGARQRSIVDAVAPMLRETGVHTGTLVLSVASKVSSPLLPVTAATAQAGELLQSWKAMGAAVVAHLPGPTLETEAAACTWVDSTSNALGETPLPLPDGQPRGRGIAIVYATSEPLPQNCAIPEIEAWLKGTSSVAAAFVTPDIDRSPATRSQRVARGPTIVLVGTALVAGGLVAASATHLLAPQATAVDVYAANQVDVETPPIAPPVPSPSARASNESPSAAATASAASGKAAAGAVKIPPPKGQASPQKRNVLPTVGAPLPPAVPNILPTSQ